MAGSDLDGVIEQYRQANSEFASGRYELLQELYSHRDDVTLLDPTGAIQRGWEEVSQRQVRNAAPGGCQTNALCYAALDGPSADEGDRRPPLQ